MNVFRFDILHPRTNKLTGPYQTSLDYLNDDVRSLINEHIMPLSHSILFLHEDMRHMTPNIYICDFMFEKINKLAYLYDSETKNKHGRPLSAFGSIAQMKSWFSLTEIYIMLCFGFHLRRYEIEYNKDLILECYIYPDDEGGQLLFSENLTRYKEILNFTEQKFIKEYEREHPEHEGLYERCIKYLK